jgi:hypothetical protein
MGRGWVGVGIREGKSRGTLRLLPASCYLEHGRTIAGSPRGQIFSVKCQTVKILGFPNHRVLNPADRAAMDNMQNKLVWHSITIKLYLQKQATSQN